MNDYRRNEVSPERIQRFMRENNISLREFAKIANLNPSTIYNAMNTKRLSKNVKNKIGPVLKGPLKVISLDSVDEKITVTLVTDKPQGIASTIPSIVRALRQFVDFELVYLREIDFLECLVFYGESRSCLIEFETVSTLKFPVNEELNVIDGVQRLFLIEQRFSVYGEAEIDTFHFGIKRVPELKENVAFVLTDPPGHIKMASDILGLRYYVNPPGAQMASWIRERVIDYKNDTHSEVIREASLQEQIRKLAQSKFGAIFEANEDKFSIQSSNEKTDILTAEDNTTQLLHKQVKRKAKEFLEIAGRIDNQPGWTGIGEAAKRFFNSVDRETLQIPERIADIWGETVELGSFIELDENIQAGKSTFAMALDAEYRRPLENLIETAAPWVRRFPTAKLLDDESIRHKSSRGQVKHATVAINIAKQATLIDDDDAVALNALVNAFERGDFRAQKAVSRGVISAKNLIGYAIAVYFGAVGSAIAPTSVLIQKSGDFALSAEGTAIELFADSPADLRAALDSLFRKLKDERENPKPLKKPLNSRLLTERARDDEHDDDDDYEGGGHGSPPPLEAK